MDVERTIARLEGMYDLWCRCVPDPQRPAACMNFIEYVHYGYAPSRGRPWGEAGYRINGRAHGVRWMVVLFGRWAIGRQMWRGPDGYFGLNWRGRVRERWFAGRFQLGR